MQPLRRISDRLVVLGLGSNLGDRAANLKAAAQAIEILGNVRLVARSSVYETPPAGGPAQADYLNAAVLVETELPFPVLMDAALAIERNLGRIRPDRVRWGPRTLDVDLLWCNLECCDDEATLVPHPRLTERPFALVPLLELCPNASDPRRGIPYSELPAARAEVRRVGAL